MTGSNPPRLVSAIAPSQISRRSLLGAALTIAGSASAGLISWRSVADIVTGLRAVDTAGHTPRHIAIEIASGNDAIAIVGDAIAHPTIAFGHPEWKPDSDHEPDRAVTTRKSLLDRLATDRSRIIGYHLPFPGIGRVERKGTAFAFMADG